MKSVSVIIPARNAAETIAFAINSLLPSRYVGEVIVIDDGSSDRTSIVAEQLHQKRVIVVPGPQSGISGALNLGFSLAKFPFLARCDADDWYPADRLERQVEWLNENLDYIAIGGGFTTVTERGKPIAELVMSGEECEITQELLDGEARTSFCTWLVRKEAIHEIGGARTWFETGEDLDLQFRLASVGRVWFQPRNTYFYRLHDASITHTQCDARRAFFREKVTMFALQRKERGSDDLECGLPPDPPAEDSALTNSARAHAVGMFNGQIWQAFNLGDTRGAFRHLWRALGGFPLSLIIWRTVFVLSFKSIIHRK